MSYLVIVIIAIIAITLVIWYLVSENGKTAVSNDPFPCSPVCPPAGETSGKGATTHRHETDRRPVIPDDAKIASRVAWFGNGKVGVTLWEAYHGEWVPLIKYDDGKLGGFATTGEIEYHLVIYLPDGQVTWRHANDFSAISDLYMRCISIWKASGML